MSNTFDGRVGYFAKRNFAFYATHVSLCVAFLLLPYIFTASGSFLRIPNFYNGHDRLYFTVYVFLLLFFYFNYYILTPRLYFNRKKSLYFFILFLFLTFFLAASFLFDRPEMSIIHTDMPPPNMPPPPKFFPNGPGHMPFGPPGGMRPNENSHTILIFLTGVLASLFLSINRRLQASERDRMEAELSLLKAQINPHFLFNTLNSIYALAIRKDDRTAESIVQLSGLMRYIMNNSTGNKIRLDAEIGYIDNYIGLQKSRLGDTVNIKYQVSGETKNQQIAPLILISFIENAFKHGVNPDEKSEIEIKIVTDGNKLKLYVWNKKVNSVQTESGIGLKNTRDRLELTYSGDYNLEVSDKENEYSIELKLEL
ncbi:sensor histidine kinase [Flavobacterium silvaticum]|uniref:Sensor histidine kinase n=1 Tax=Flavobacterium silvaticum TaxID=1852020 RepID=A0A972JHY4_9FLAO|nr:histidine kinase [Flavobacterium silvaticum]NMH28425.1 sensor histidine kinase [Flavobacterium silvaticum]